MKRTLPFLLASIICSTVLAQSAPATGLDALFDDRLFNELANRRLTTLLDRAFEINNVPKEKRDGWTTLIALQQLSDPSERLTVKQRQDVLKKVISGIEQALPAMTDGTALMQQAKTIIEAGTERDVNMLEYFGPNPVTMNQLRPIMQVVGKIYTKAAEEYRKQEADLANKLTDPKDPRLNKVDELENMAILADYSGRMSDYNTALAMDGNDPARRELIDNAIKKLQDWNTPDSPVQVPIKNRIAKFNMLKGDFDTAKKLFDEVINGAGKINPPPNIGQQYEARYFSVQSDILAGKLDVATKSIDELEAWEKSSLPKEFQQNAAAALTMLKFRLQSKSAEMAKTDAEKDKANEAAIAVLTQLQKDRPDLIGIINEQMMARLPANPDVTKLNPLLLQAMIGKANNELNQPEGVKPDKTALERGVAAGVEFISRKGNPGIVPKFVDDAAIRLPLFLDKLDRKMEAANSYIDYLKNFGPANKENGQFALENAAALIVQARKNDATDEAASKAWDRFLPVAIAPPYNRTELAYTLAARQQQMGQFKDAVKYFRLVPTSDPNYLLSRYRLMVTLKLRLDNEGKAIVGQEKGVILAEIQSLADEVNKSAAAGLASAADDKAKGMFQGMLVRTSLLAADLAKNMQNDPQRALDLLKDFENRAKGLPNENDLVPEALLLTVNSQMALGQTTQATKSLVELLNRRPGGEGAQIVFNLLQKLNEQYDRAKKEGNQKLLKRLADDRATLSGFLVDWAKNNPKPEIKNQTYVYQRFDAGTKHDAAELEADEAKRTTSLKDALALFDALKSKENLAAYKASVKTPGEYDPQVDFKIAMIQFDLKNFPECSRVLGRLRKDAKLGRAMKPEMQNGQEVLVDNDQYWEATYKELKSIAEIAKANPAQATDLDEAKRFLKRLYVERGAQIGGKLWHDEFEALRKEMTPEFDPGQVGESAVTGPTTVER